MPNRTLALDVGGATLRAALVESTLRSQRILGFYVTPRSDDLAADLRTLTTAHDLHWDEVISALPGHLVAHRVLTLPFHDRKRLDQTVPFELENQLPFDLDDAVVDYQVLGRDGDAAVVLAAFASKVAVREHLALLAAAGVDPRVVDLTPLAVVNVLRIAQVGRGAQSAFIALDHDRATVGVLEDGRLRGLRTLSRGAGINGDLELVTRDVRWSLLALAGDAALDSLELWIGGDTVDRPEVAAALGEALGVTPRTLATLSLAGVPITLRREQAAFAAPLGLALREGGDAFGIDFRRGEFTYHREREALWRGLAVAGVLAAIALALMVTSFVLEGRRLAARRDAVRGEIRALFTAALPNVRTIVNEKAQLAAEIAALEKQRQVYGGLAPSAPRALDLLKAVTQGVPADVQLDIEELALDGENLRLRGSTRTYEGVEGVKRGLATRPEFRDVQAKDVRASVDGSRVDFRLLLTPAHGDDDAKGSTR
jgi:general secretion pathway protein L